MRLNIEVNQFLETNSIDHQNDKGSNQMALHQKRNANLTQRSNFVGKNPSVESFDAFDKFDIDNYNKNNDVLSIYQPSFFGCHNDEESQGSISEIKQFNKNSDKPPSSTDVHFLKENVSVENIHQNSESSKNHNLEKDSSAKNKSEGG